MGNNTDNSFVALSRLTWRYVEVQGSWETDIESPLFLESHRPRYPRQRAIFASLRFEMAELLELLGQIPSDISVQASIRPSEAADGEQPNGTIFQSSSM